MYSSVDAADDMVTVVTSVGCEVGDSVTVETDTPEVVSWRICSAVTVDTVDCDIESFCLT